MVRRALGTKSHPKISFFRRVVDQSCEKCEKCEKCDFAGEANLAKVVEQVDAPSARRGVSAYPPLPSEESYTAPFMSPPPPPSLTPFPGSVASSEPPPPTDAFVARSSESSASDKGMERARDHSRSPSQLSQHGRNEWQAFQDRQESFQTSTTIDPGPDPILGSPAAASAAVLRCFRGPRATCGVSGMYWVGVGLKFCFLVLIRLLDM